MPFPVFFMSRTDLQSLLPPPLDKMEGEMMCAPGTHPGLETQDAAGLGQSRPSARVFGANPFTRTAKGRKPGHTRGAPDDLMTLGYPDSVDVITLKSN